MSTPKRRVAIACQGGGSHTAFTAGALSRFLQPDVLADHEIVALSGTSGGAICAARAWSALLRDRPEDASGLLAQFWTANTATTWPERIINNMVLWGSRLAETVALPAVSPYLHAGAVRSSQQLARMVDETVDLEAAQALATELGADAPQLLLGAVDVVNGSFRAFNSRRGEISTAAILASAAIPNIFRSVRIGNGIYWDGLFSQNPPGGVLREADPDEIWVIQINPTRIDREPRLLTDITTRRNELAGNLSLYQELGFIERLDRWLADGTITSDKLRHVTVRILEMNRLESSKEWGYASKLNRDPDFIGELIQLGRDQADEQLKAMGFEHAWSRGELDRMLDQFAPNALVSSDHPEARLAPTRDKEAIRAYIDGLGLCVDASRARVSRESVSWDVRASGNSARRGKLFATFEDGSVTRMAFTD